MKRKLALFLAIASVMTFSQGINAQTIMSEDVHTHIGVLHSHNYRLSGPSWRETNYCYNGGTHQERCSDYVCSCGAGYTRRDSIGCRCIVDEREYF